MSAYRTAGGVVAAVVLVLLAMVVYDGTQDDHVAEGIAVGTVDVGGRDADAAIALVRRELEPRVRRPVVLTHRSQRFTLTPEAAKLRLDAAASVEQARRRGRQGNAVGRTLTRLRGADVDAAVAPRITYDEAAVRRWLGGVAEEIDRGARNADIEFVDGKLERTKARTGLQVSRDALTRKVLAQLGAPAAAGRPIAVPVRTVDRPQRTLTELADRYPTVIAIDRDAKVLRLYKDLRLRA